MNIHTNRQWQAGLALCLVAIVVSIVQFRGTAAAVDCVGKPYGTPGCPTKAVASSQSITTGYCGNGIVEGTEDCDKGRFNGKTDCSEQCRWLYCGDGILTKDLGEECEPQTQEVYVLDDAGNLTTEVQFTESAECGWYCAPPRCDEDGNCHDGCRRQLLEACTEEIAEEPVEEEVFPDETTSIADEMLPMEEEVVTPEVSTSSSSKKSGDVYLGVDRCGNFVVENDEECDDGNAVDLDSCTTKCRRPRCGDKIQQEGEECDDGNADSNDRCTTLCTIPRCGDGFAQKGEQCDDGNVENNDYCTNDCKLPRCGDGIRQEPEECDDGTDNSDGMPNGCRTTCKKAFCGDRVTDEGEACDAGSDNSNAKSNTCRLDCRLPRCGDGVADASEQCDDGNMSDEDACTTACRTTRCGDGFVQSGEQCDWGDRNSAAIPGACRPNCRLPSCGDGIVDAGEQCDGSSDCSAQCVMVEILPAETEDTSSSASQEDVVTVPEPELHAAADDAILGLPISAVAGVSAGTGVFIFFLWLLTKGKYLLGFSKAVVGKSLDDIPLDQIEMPYHRW